jgi:hypothetical protein
MVDHIAQNQHYFAFVTITFSRIFCWVGSNRSGRRRATVTTAVLRNQPANPKKAPRKPTGLRHAPVWRAEFLSGRIVAMVGSGLRESCAERSMDASMLGPILARRQLWRASFFGVVGAIARTTNDSRPNEIDRLHGHGASRGAWSSWRRRELAAGAQGQHGRKQRGPDAKLIK